MSTFFEKLTKSAAEPLKSIQLEDDGVPQPQPAAPPRRGRPPREARPVDQEERQTHLRVEEGEKGPKPKREEPEEEGELTLDIYDEGDYIVIQSTVAGVAPENLDVSITSDSVSIRGKREKEKEVSEPHYYYKELFWGSFSRSVILPEEIDSDKAEATLKHGLLTIRLPKKKKGEVQKLKVKMN